MTKKSDERLVEYYETQLGYARNRIARDNYDKARPSVNNPTPGWHKRQYVWRHNSLIGHVVMMRQQLNAMVDAPSTSQETKHYAKSILGLIPKLQNSLSVRIDPKEGEN